MNIDFVWKNFSLGKELDIAGSFIYNGLKALDSMETFYYEDFKLGKSSVYFSISFR